jgi:hypothetical protein
LHAAQISPIIRTAMPRRPRRQLPSTKIAWRGTVTSVQPRIRLTRSFDQRSHTYQGYVLQVEGCLGDEMRPFLVAIGEGAQAKHGITCGDTVSGVGMRVADRRSETAELYKVSGLKVEARAGAASAGGPPWRGVPPPLSVYRERGHRRLAASTYAAKCTSCIWGCLMPVELIIDHWNPTQRQYRTETFCYGPGSCLVYKPGPTRKVPGRRGLSYEEEDWVDQEATAHRGADE